MSSEHGCAGFPGVGMECFGDKPRDGIFGLYGSFIFLNLQTNFQGGCTSLLSTHPSHQHLLLLVSLVMGILPRERGDLKLIFICTSLMATDVEHFLMCFLAICISSFENFCLVM